MSLKPRAGFATSEERFKDGHSVNLPGPGHYTTVNMNIDRAETNGYFGTSLLGLLKYSVKLILRHTQQERPKDPNTLYIDVLFRPLQHTTRQSRPRRTILWP